MDGNIGMLWEKGDWLIYGTNWPTYDRFANRFFIKFRGGDSPSDARLYQPLIYTDGVVEWHTMKGRSKIPMEVRKAFEKHAVPAYLKQREERFAFFAGYPAMIREMTKDTGFLPK